MLPVLNSSLPPGIVRSSRTFQLILAAAGSTQSIQRVPQVGTAFYIVESNNDASVGVKTDKTQQELFSVGTGKKFTEENFFTSLEFQNFSSVAIVITVFAGFGDFIDNRTTIVGNRLTSILPVIEPGTFLVANAATSLAAAGNIDLTGTPPSTLYYRRKAVMVSNLDPTNSLNIKDQAGAIALVVFAATSVIIPSSLFIRVNNASGSTIALSVSEIWWMKP